MAGGLFALLDDVAAIAKLAAASADDVVAGAGKAAAKSAGVIIDDAAVTPQYVAGIAADRELGVIGRIAKGSIFNKLLIIIPLALILSQFAEWALPILLLAGGTFLAYEGAEKVMGWVGLGHHGEEHHDDAPAVLEEGEAGETAEDRVVGGAIRTDLILSAEIMLISLAALDTDSFWERLAMLVVIAVIMTAGVYGAVALLVRMDDFGIRLMTRESAASKRTGKALVKGMPKVLSIISVIGTIAMLWVGGHLLLVNSDEVGWSAPHDTLHAVTHAIEGAGGLVTWLADTAVSGVAGLIWGLLVVGLLTVSAKLIPKRHK